MVRHSLIALALPFLGGCPAGPATPPALAAAPTPTAMMQPAREGPDPRNREVAALVLIGETLGWLEPCGCTEGMLGGIARRASYLKQLRARGFEPILLDLGDLVRDPGPQAELKIDALARAYALMGVRALAPGERDIPYLGRLRERRLPLLSAAPGARLEVPSPAGPLRVAALVGPYNLPSFEYAGVSATAVLGDAPADVVLFHGSRDEARAALAKAPPAGEGGPLVVLTGHDVEVPPPPETLPNGTILLTSGDKAKFAALVLVRRAPGGARTAEVAEAAAPLGDRVADDPEIARIVDEYKDTLTAMNLPDQQARKTPETGGSYVGAQECKACHKKESEVYAGTRHAHAFESLGPRKGTRDPECLRCHATGYGYASGFAGPERTPELAKVSCEACHGVGSNHSANPAPGSGFGRIREPAAKLCVECHDKENSPGFDFATYWPRIAHGRKR